MGKGHFLIGDGVADLIFRHGVAPFSGEAYGQRFMKRSKARAAKKIPPRRDSGLTDF
jgi:hypothetical protein